MTTTIFIILATILCMVSTLLTEAIKTFLNNKSYVPNLIALIDAIVVGCGGTAVTYILIGIPFNTQNVICLILMAFIIWIGSMIGYDKVLQLVKQITSMKINK